jgi:hypothetical protein
VKRKADSIFAKEKDLPNGQVFYEELSNEQSNVKLFYVTEQEIEKMDPLLPDCLERIRGTMKTHQEILIM